MTEAPDPIDVLLGAGPRRAVTLPDPAERLRLRLGYGLNKAETAKALGVSAGTFAAWESGQRDPQGESRAAYARLLEGMSARLGPAEPPTAAPPGHGDAPTSELGALGTEVPVPSGPAAVRSRLGPGDAAPASAPGPEQPAMQPEPAAAPATAPVSGLPAGHAQALTLDQLPSGELVLEPPAACVRCGRPTPYRSGGRPIHMGGWSTPAAAPVQPSVPEAAPHPTPRRAPQVRPAPQVRSAPQVRPAGQRPSAAKRPPAARPAAAQAPADWERAAAARFPAGPLAVVDSTPTGKGLLAVLVDGSTVDVPARTLPDLVAWALGAGLGSPRLHRHGKDGDPLVVLTDAAATDLGLPPAGRAKGDFDARGNRLPETHRVVKALAKEGWLLTQRGLGPWARIYRTPEGGRRECVQLCVPLWGALATGGWAVPADTTAAGLARLLGRYAAEVLTPRGSTAVSGLELMTALRPPTQAVRTDAGWTSGPVPGSLTEAVDPAPPGAPDEHPVAEGRAPGPEHVLDEEAWDWFRPLDRIGADERGAPYAVGLDVNTAFLSAAGRLSVGLSEPVHELNPVFDRELPGCWLVDLSGLALDPRLPNPFTPTGEPPTGPAWYATPTVAYAVELGADVRPAEGWLRHVSGPYLDPWHKRLRDAYVAVMQRLGVPLDLADQDPQAFLDAMAALGTDGDPVDLAVLAAVKQTAKGGIGKLRERPRGHGYRPGMRWAALERPTWRPDVRAAVIATARVNFHRKLRRTAEATGRHPIGVLSDCAVYPAAGPSALDVLPYGPDGRPVPGVLRLGASPGHVKSEGVRQMPEVLALVAEGINPARHIKAGTDAVADGE
ncbi:telomere-associated protein Tap [Streptomyces sp. NRRL B-24484]|uniref:telomere-associated protein Tap n=1 Tax=Streptomyces sp. NRRL B-24484 TaxID=1463833 RepID=UPI000694141C|nr:helix-turn-helix transcriptional regulator [Streptomyces sp. NRRL B-24484]